MGISKFNGQLVKNMAIRYEDAKIGTYPTTNSGLMIDLNDLLHFFSQKVYLYGNSFKNPTPKQIKFRDSKTESQLEDLYIKSILNRLDYYLDEFEPEDYFIVVVDGPAPLAKIQQQRMRRFSSPPTGSTYGFDCAKLSPGTELMEKIHLAIKAWFYDKASKDKLPTLASYSSHHEPGEGEHKMIQILLNNRKDIFNGDPKGLHAICGQDSDLLMLGTLIPYKNVVWYREDRDKEIRTGSPDAEIRMVDAFKKEVYKNFMRDKTEVDYVLSYFLFGNDFIPKNPAFYQAEDTMKDISKAYATNGKRLVDLKTGKIIRRNFLDFLEKFVPMEQANLDMAAATYNGSKQLKYPILTENTKTLKNRRIVVDLEGFKQDWYQRTFDTYNEMACKECEGSKGYTETKYTDPEVFMRDMMEHYLEMLQWNLDYYRGRKISWNFQYKFYFSPLLSDVAMLPREGDIARHYDDWKDESSIVRQLMMISHPGKVKDFIPKTHHGLLTNPIIKEMSPGAPIFFEDGETKKNSYLFKTILPLVTHDMYENIISEHKISIPSRMEVHLSPGDIYIKDLEVSDDSADVIPGSHTKIRSHEKFAWAKSIVS